MAKEIRLMVTSPYHGADGMSVLYQPGDRFPLDADLPPDLLTTEVIVDVPDAPQGDPAAGGGQDDEGAAGKGDAAPAAEAAKPSPPPSRPGTSRGTRSSSS